MEKYLIYYNESQTSKKFIGSIYRGSVSTYADMGDSIEFIDKDTALKMAEYINKREGVTKYRVMCIKTTIEEVTE